MACVGKNCNKAPKAIQVILKNTQTNLGRPTPHKAQCRKTLLPGDKSMRPLSPNPSIINQITQHQN